MPPPNRPSLFRWLFRWTVGATYVLTALFVVLVVMNVIDYVPYGLALHRIHKLNAAQWAELAAATTRYEKAGHQRFTANAIPAEFRQLKPIRIDFYPGSSDITLLERGDDATKSGVVQLRYVFVRIDTTPDNQTVESVTYAGNRQHQHLLWQRNPEAAKTLAPTGRLVTVSQWSMTESHDWIVLPGRVLVIDRRPDVGKSDRILADIPLSVLQRERIEAAARGIGPAIRGHAFDAGIIDGIHLRISFSEDGSRRFKDDVFLDNSWRDELAPLMQAISDVLPKEHAITFADSVRRMDDSFGGAPQRVQTLAEFERSRNPFYLPWWCWWPRLFSADA